VDEFLCESASGGRGRTLEDTDHEQEGDEANQAVGTELGQQPDEVVGDSCEE
jgi:hypothetical protein